MLFYLQAFTGLLRVKHKGVKTRDDATHLLCHELVRVFQDRCLLPLDKERVLEILTEALRIHCKVSAPQFSFFVLKGFHNYCSESSSWVTNFVSTRRSESTVKLYIIS